MNPPDNDADHFESFVGDHFASAAAAAAPSRAVSASDVSCTPDCSDAVAATPSQAVSAFDVSCTPDCPDGTEPFASAAAAATPSRAV